MLQDAQLAASLECDLQETYGVDLVDLWRGKLSLRRLLVLIKGLRPGARIHKDWSQAEHFAADQVDLMSRVVWLCYMMAQGLGAKPKHLRKPPPLIKRPQQVQEEKAKKFSSPVELTSFLAQKPARGRRNG